MSTLPILVPEVILEHRFMGKNGEFGRLATLTLHRGVADGRLYLEHWCTRRNLNRTIRTLVVPTDKTAISVYVSGQSTLGVLLTIPNEDRGWIVDTLDSNSVRYNVENVQVSRLPPSYLPKPLTMHEKNRPAE